MNALANLQKQLAESMLREQEAKEATAQETLEAMTEARAAGAVLAEENRRKAVVERETAEMIQRAYAEGIAKDRNPGKDWS